MWSGDEHHHRVRALDSARVAAPVVGTGSLDRVSERGLLLLEVLASSWVVVPNGLGKVVVWFEVQA
jgi:hypothetical protein